MTYKFDDSVRATHVNRQGKYFRLEDGSILRFDTMLDITGEETQDPAKCVIALYQLPNGMYSGTDLRQFDADQQEITQ